MASLLEYYVGHKLSKKLIKQVCLNSFANDGFTVTDTENADWLGQNSLTFFHLKEIPYWKFGLWIDIDEKANEYRIWFYGDKEDWIDKFKPSRSTVASKEYRLPFAVTKKNQYSYSSIDMPVFSMMDALKRLKKNRRIAEYGLYGTHDGFIEWLAGEIWYYDIVKPLTAFYKEYFESKLYTLLVKYIAFKYRKFVKAREVIDLNIDGYRVSPRYECGVEYLDNISDDDMFNTWCAIEDSWIAKFINKKSRFLQYKDKNDHIGFYYPETEE